MSCAQFGERLLPYQLGTLEGRERLELEEHLPDCGECVRAFVAIKLAMESGDAALRPSDAARARLRQAVAKELYGSRRRRAGLVAAAMAAALLLLAIWRFGAQAPGRGPGAAGGLSGVDSALPEQTVDHVL